MRFSYKNRIVEFLNHPDFRSCVYINILARNYIKAEILLPTYSRDVPCTKTVSFVLLNFGFSKSQRCNSNLTEGIQVCTYVSSSYAAKSRNSARIDMCKDERAPFTPAKRSSETQSEI